tara:strand:+ start:2874 stop:5594 length:2721 start_codon:yes stop_codon:yes gene_type:complete
MKKRILIFGIVLLMLASFTSATCTSVDGCRTHLELYYNGTASSGDLVDSSPRASYNLADANGAAVSGGCAKVGDLGASLDGSDDYFSNSNQMFSTNPMDEYTICMWVKPDSCSGQRWITYGENGLWNRHYITTKAGSWQIQEGGTQITTGTCSAGSWQYLCNIMYTNTTYQAYKDNALYGSATGATKGSSSDGFLIGAWEGDPSWADNFDGCVDEVAIFNRSMTPAELTYLYNSGDGRSLLGGVAAPPPAVAANKTIAYYYPASNFETNPSKIEVDLVQYNVTNNTVAQLIYGNQTITAVANVTNQTNARFWANVTSFLIPSQVAQPFYFNFSLNHTNGSINKGYNSSNASQTLNVGCFVNHVVLGPNGLLQENNTYSSQVNVSTLGLCRLVNLKYQFDGAFYTQPVATLDTTGQTASNQFNFDVSIPHTYFNLSQHKVNITAEFRYRNFKNHNLSATSNVIWNLTKHPRFNISVYDLINNQPLLNFTAFNGKSIGTTNGSVFWWEYGAGVHEIGVNNTAYELVKKDLTFTAGLFQHETYYLYTTNSFNFTLRNERTDELITQNATLEFIGDAKSYNYTIQNGKLYVDLLVPSNYTIRYQTNPAIGKTNASIDYGLKRSYLVKLTDQSHQDLTLYLLDNGNSTTTKVTVYDQNSLTGVEGAAVYVERYFLQGNAYKTVAMCSTGVAGECNFDLEHNEELYKFKVEFPWLTPKTTTVPSYISSTTLNLYIDLFKKAGENFFLQEGIAGSIAYSSSTPTFTATYTDTENSASQVCLKLKSYGQYSKQVLNESCSTAASGTLIVTGFAPQKSNYGVLTATVGGQEKVIKAVWKDLNTDKLQAGASGVFLSAMVFIILALLSVVHVYAAILGSVGLIFAYMMGMLAIDLSYLILILGSSIILAIIIQMKR